MLDILQDSVWIRAAELIKEKYGKTVTYRAIKLLSEETIQTANKAYYAAGDDLVIPLKAKDHILGDVIVSRGSFLDFQQKAEVVDLIKFLVEPKLYNLQLKQSEQSLKQNQIQKAKNFNESSQVYSLFEDDGLDSRQTLSQVILLKSHVELNRHRVALKIHDMTQKNLFVHFEDIHRSIQSVEDISSLSDVTIYVPDVEQLNPEMIEVLQAYLSAPLERGPLFLVGSSLSMESILEKNWPNDLKRDLAGFFFDIDRVPISQQTSEEILDLLFFKFDALIF